MGLKFFLSRKTIMVGTKKIKFLINVSQFDKIMASPKQPQSVTGFVNARKNVRIVKNDIKIIKSQLVILIKILVRRFNPIISSKVHKIIEKIIENLARKGIPNALK